MSQPRERNLYEVLEVSSSASPETIRAAYKSLLQRYHPDKHRENPKIAELARQMIDAYQVLSDPKARAAYDRKLGAAHNSAEASSAASRRPAAAPAAPTSGGRITPAVFVGTGAALLFVLLGALWLLRPEAAKPAVDVSASVAPAPADNVPPAPPQQSPAGYDAQTPEARDATPGMKDWLLAYRNLDPAARVVQVNRLVNNGTLPVVPGYGRFFSDPAELRKSFPGLVMEAPTALGREDAAALDDLQSWWFAPGQLNLLVLNDLNPRRPMIGFIFEVAAGDCAAGQPIGAIAVDLGTATVEPGQAALLRIALQDMPREALAPEMCGTIVSGFYGSSQSTNPQRPQSADDREYDALLAQAERDHPELDPKTRRFSQASTNWVAARVELYVRQGKSRTQALRAALADYQAGKR